MALGYRSLIFDISANVARLTQQLGTVTNQFRKMESDVSKVMTGISGVANKTIGGIAFGTAIVGFERLMKSTADMGRQQPKILKDFDREVMCLIDQQDNVVFPTIMLNQQMLETA